MPSLCEVVISSCAICAVDSLAENAQLIWHGHNLPQIRSSGKQCLSVFALAAVFPVEKAAAWDTCSRSTDLLVHLQLTHPSVHIGTVLLGNILPGETFHLTSPADFREKGRLLCVPHRWHTCQWKSDWTTRQQASSQHGARDCFNTSLGLRRLKFNTNCAVCWKLLVEMTAD